MVVPWGFKVGSSSINLYYLQSGFQLYDYTARVIWPEAQKNSDGKVKCKQKRSQVHRSRTALKRPKDFFLFMTKLQNPVILISRTWQ
jgi:hypothetical protein